MFPIDAGSSGLRSELGSVDRSVCADSGMQVCSRAMGEVVQWLWWLKVKLSFWEDAAASWFVIALQLQLQGWGPLNGHLPRQS